MVKKKKKGEEKYLFSQFELKILMAKLEGHFIYFPLQLS